MSDETKWTAPNGWRAGDGSYPSPPPKRGETLGTRRWTEDALRVASDAVLDVPIVADAVARLEARIRMDAGHGEWGDSINDRGAIENVVAATVLALRAREERLRAVVGADTPWPLRSVLEVLWDACVHLQRAHDCDHMGHERRDHALREVNRYINALAALDSDTPEPAGDPELAAAVARLDDVDTAILCDAVANADPSSTLRDVLIALAADAGEEDDRG